MVVKCLTHSNSPMLGGKYRTPFAKWSSDFPHPSSADSRVWKQKPTKGPTSSPSRNWPIHGAGGAQEGQNSEHRQSTMMCSWWEGWIFVEENSGTHLFKQLRVYMFCFFSCGYHVIINQNSYQNPAEASIISTEASFVFTFWYHQVCYFLFYFFYSLRFNWHIHCVGLRCTVWWFDTWIYCELITNRLIHPLHHLT